MGPRGNANGHAENGAGGGSRSVLAPAKKLLWGGYGNSAERSVGSPAVFQKTAARSGTPRALVQGPPSRGHARW